MYILDTDHMSLPPFRQLGEIWQLPTFSAMRQTQLLTVQFDPHVLVTWVKKIRRLCGT